MASSPSTVITLGLGSWGSTSLVVTLGLGAGSAITDACSAWPRGAWPTGAWPDTCPVEPTGGESDGAGFSYGAEPRRAKRSDGRYEGRIYRKEDAEIVSRETHPDIVDAEQARLRAKQLSDEIVEANQEIARIKTQMRLSSNAEAISALEREIAAVEKSILKAKHDAEDMILLAILL